MIVKFFLHSIYLMGSYIIAHLPMGAGFPIEVDTAVSFMAQFVHVLDFILPTYALWDAMTLILSFRLIVWGFHMVVWIRHTLLPRII